jgi:hypothetical protein
VPNIRDNVYLKYIGDLYSENSDGLYLSLDYSNSNGEISDYKLVLSRDKTPFTLHEFDTQYLRKKYSELRKSDYVRLEEIAFVTVNSDSEVYFELSSSGKGYVLSRRIHMCGAHGYIKINDDEVGFDLNQRPKGIFRLENDLGEFIFIHSKN